MNFGWKTDGGRRRSRSWTAASTLGINFFDTANVYGWTPARAAPSRSSAAGSPRAAGAASATVLATKVYDEHGRLAQRRPALRAATSAAPARRSLRRLQTDYIDLYQMHHVDRDTPWDEIWQAMELLVQQGKVLYVGSSNFAGWHIAQANEAAARAALPGPRLASRASTT